MERAVERTLKPLDALVQSIRAEFTSATGSLATMRTDVAVIRNEQATQGREIGEIKSQVRSLNDELLHMPDRWESDVAAAVTACRSQRDEITAVQNLAKERGHAKPASPSLAPRARRDSWIADAIRQGLKPFLQFLVLAAVLAGVSLAASRCGGGIDFDRTQRQLEQVQKQLEKLNGGAR